MKLFHHEHKFTVIYSFCIICPEIKGIIFIRTKLNLNKLKPKSTLQDSSAPSVKTSSIISTSFIFLWRILQPQIKYNEK